MKKATVRDIAQSVRLYAATFPESKNPVTGMFCRHFDKDPRGGGGLVPSCIVGHAFDRVEMDEDERYVVSSGAVGNALDFLSSRGVVASNPATPDLPRWLGHVQSRADNYGDPIPWSEAVASADEMYPDIEWDPIETPVEGEVTLSALHEDVGA